MRRVVLSIILSMCALSVFAYNEEVAAISYNPSRSGVYQNLVAVREAVFGGGVTVVGGEENPGTMNIQAASGYTVTLQDQDGHDDGSTTQNHKCKEAAEGGCTELNTITNVVPQSDGEGTISVNMNGTMQGYNEGSPYLKNLQEEISKENFPSLAQGTDINVYGGNIQTGNTYIDTINVDNDNKHSDLEFTIEQIEVGTERFDILLPPGKSAADKGTLLLGTTTKLEGNFGEVQNYHFVTIKDADNKNHTVLSVELKKVL